MPRKATGTVKLTPKGRFRARVTLNGKRAEVGTFDTREAAEEALARFPREQKRARKLRERREDGTVYFVEALHTGLIKIGWTGRPLDARLSVMQTDCPYQLRVLAIVPRGTAFERACHKHFMHLRVRGEWFEGTEELRGFVDRQRRKHAPLDVD